MGKVMIRYVSAIAIMLLSLTTKYITLIAVMVIYLLTVYGNNVNFDSKENDSNH